MFAVFLVVQWGSAYLGDLCRKKLRPVQRNERPDFDTVLTATLTLLALIIGFSFSMAVSRYDQRKNYEEAEANAISTEYARAELLSSDAGLGMQDALRTYLDQRILFYRGEASQTPEHNGRGGTIEARLWSAATQSAKAQPTPIVALVVSGMNDVLNSRDFTQAAWWNRIPGAAWSLMSVIAIVSNLLLGYRERTSGLLVLLVLPVVSSIAFFLIADIDSPGAIAESW